MSTNIPTGPTTWGAARTVLETRLDDVEAAIAALPDSGTYVTLTGIQARVADAIAADGTPALAAAAAVDQALVDQGGIQDPVIAAAVADPASETGQRVARVRNLSGPGIDLTGTNVSTTAVKALLDTAQDGDRFVGVAGATYKLDWTGPLVSWTSRRQITVDLSASTITCPTAMATLSPLFQLSACRSIDVKIGRFVGATISNPLTNLSKVGPSLVHCINACRDISLDFWASNIRDGLRAGDYADGSKGYTRGVRVKARGELVGYPVALYLAEDVEVDVDVDGVHRAGYFGGVHGARGTLRFRDQYGADTVCLITDALVSGSDAAAEANPTGTPTVSRGCEDVDLLVVDKGSTVYGTPSMLAGILASRADAVTFRDITVKMLTTASGNVSRFVGGFRILSGASTVFPRYAGKNWHPDTLIDRLTISGVIDHRLAGVGSTGNALMIEPRVTGEATSATLSNFAIDDLAVLRRPATAEFMIVAVTKPQGTFRIRGLYAPGSQLLWNVAGGSVTVDASRLGVLDNQGAGSVVATGGTSIDTVNGPAPTNAGALIGGARAGVRTAVYTRSIADVSSVTIAGAIPAKSLLLGVTTTVTKAITNAPGFRVGTSAASDRFGVGSGTGVGSTAGPFSAAAATTMSYQDAAQDIVVGSTGVYFMTGEVMVAVHYIDYSAPVAPA